MNLQLRVVAHWRPMRTWLAAASCLSASVVAAQAQAVNAPAPAGARPVVFTPTVTVTQTLTSNALLDDANRRADAVTAISAGVSASSRGKRLQGTLDYELTGFVHARSSKANETSNSLRASAKSELVDDWLFLDANATIGQRTISAFGVQTSDPSISNPNRTEVRTLVVTPSLRGQIGSLANYQAQVSRTEQSNSTGDVGDMSGSSATINISSAGPNRAGWGLLATRTQTRYDAGRSTATDAVRASFNYRMSPDLRVSLSGGRERSNLLDVAGSSGSIWGAGLDWLPSERTRVSLQRDRRFLGDSHLISLDHRLARTVWRFTSTKDISTSQPTFLNAGWSSYYDLLYANLASTIADPDARRQAVLQQMALQGVSLNAPAGSVGFLSSAVTMASRQDLSVAYQGLRTSLTFAIYRSDTRRLDAAAQVLDDLSDSALVKQDGVTLTVSHRLTPASYLNLTAFHQRTRGSRSSQSNEQSSFNVGWTSQFGRTGDVSFGARHIEFDSTTVPYNESAVFATLRMRF